MKTEKRFSPLTELRIEDGESPKIVGYAAVFNSRSVDMGGWYEIVSPGAFTRTLKDNADVRALVNHDPDQMLGRTKSGTLKLMEDAKGLRAEITPPDTQAARDAVSLIKRGDMSQMSFAFRLAQNGDIVKRDGKDIVRHLLDVDLSDVSVVAYPAYEQTEVNLRSLVDRIVQLPEESMYHIDLLKRKLSLKEKQ
jgi:HK97 family phage prohead protease